MRRFPIARAHGQLAAFRQVAIRAGIRIGRGPRAWVVAAGAALVIAALVVHLDQRSDSHRLAGSQQPSRGLGQLFNRETYDYSTTLSTRQEARRYGYLVLQLTNAAIVPRLHAANPGLKILMYQSALTSATTDPRGATTCTSYPSDNEQHRDWFLTNARGDRRLSADVPDEYVMDIGNPGYQRACLAHAEREARRYHFNGIFFDGLVARPEWILRSGVSSPRYSSTAAWDAAVSSFITYAGRSIHRARLLVVGNLGVTVPAQWQRWTAPLDGSMEESWTDGSYGLAQQISAWPAKLANVAWSEAHAKITLLHSYNTTEAGNTYGLASMLLVADGHTSYSTSNNCYTSCETWYHEYTTAQQLGAPTGPYAQLPSGVYERAFARGLVIVNPTAQPIPSVSLGGVYSGSGLVGTRSAALPPTSGLILLKARKGGA